MSFENTIAEFLLWGISPYPDPRPGNNCNSKSKFAKLGRVLFGKPVLRTAMYDIVKIIEYEFTFVGTDTASGFPIPVRV